MEERQIKDIENMLEEIKEMYPTKFRPALLAIINCLTNIVQHPDNESYRIIKSFDRSILKIPGILDIFDMIGFSQDESGNKNTLILEGESIDYLNNYISMFKKYLPEDAQHPQPQGREVIQIQKIQSPLVKEGEPKYRSKPIIYKIPPKNRLDSKNIDNGIDYEFNKLKESNKNLKNKGYNNPNIYNNKYNNNDSESDSDNDSDIDSDNDNVIFNDNDNEMDGNRVIYFMYDLSGGIAKGLSGLILGKEIEGIYHTSVYVYGKEYYYQGGIAKSSPRKTSYGKPIKEIHFGNTNKTQTEFEKYLKRISRIFSPDLYNTISNNCNHFTDAALFYLTGKHLPNHILKQHENILKTPLGKQITPYLEKESGINGAQNSGNNPLMFLVENAINNIFDNKRKFNNNKKKSYYYNAFE